jgi:hypothetical protein
MMTGEDFEASFLVNEIKGLMTVDYSGTPARLHDENHLFRFRNTRICVS